MTLKHEDVHRLPFLFFSINCESDHLLFIESDLTITLEWDVRRYFSENIRPHCEFFVDIFKNV